MQKYKTLDEFFNDLDADKHAQVTVLRELILEAGPQLEERIKWNAPSYVLDGEDRITFNLMNKQGIVKLVLHMGATRKENKNGTPIMHDDSGLIEWSSDIRGMLSFRGLEDITPQKDSLKAIFQTWLSIPATVN